MSAEIPLPVDPPGHPAPSTPRRLLRRLVRPLAFVGVSGIGWLIDLTTFFVLTQAFGWRGSVSNVVSSGLGIAFVFAASHGRLFGGERADRAWHFVMYILWQVVLVGSVSVAIDAIVDGTGVLPIVAKIGLTPVTIVLNYVVLSRLARWRPGRGGTTEPESADEPGSGTEPRDGVTREDRAGRETGRGTR